MQMSPAVVGEPSRLGPRGFHLPTQHLAVSCDHWAAADLRKWRVQGWHSPCPPQGMALATHGWGPAHHTAWGGA